MSFAVRVWRYVRRIPRGRVSTYGAIAAQLGRPRGARAVGQAMRACPADIPWHRVVNAQGGISRRARASGMLTQRIRLEHEGVVFERGRVARIFWVGGLEAPPKPPALRVAAPPRRSARAGDTSLTLPPFRGAVPRRAARAQFEERHRPGGTGRQQGGS